MCRWSEQWPSLTWNGDPWPGSRCWTVLDSSRRGQSDGMNINYHGTSTALPSLSFPCNVYTFLPETPLPLSHLLQCLDNCGSHYTLGQDWSNLCDRGIQERGWKSRSCVFPGTKTHIWAGERRRDNWSSDHHVFTWATGRTTPPKGAINSSTSKRHLRTKDSEERKGEKNKNGEMEGRVWKEGIANN